MRKYIPWMALLAAACLFTLTACGEKKPAVSSVEEPASSSLPVQQKPEETEEKTPESTALSMSDARRLLAEDIDTDDYMILDGGTKLEVEGDSYYLFIIANRTDNKVVGQLAVNKKTGDKYNYEGEGTLGDYSEFSLYNPETDAVYDWEGIFVEGERTLELLPIDENSFEYILGDLTGVARIEGSTAQDLENNVTFSWDEDGGLVLLGDAEGNFAPAPAEE
ncbi:MAG: hypothetical protein ACI3XZ_00100 [Butyricicoccus sp.]